MKAAVVDQYGPPGVAQVTEVPAPALRPGGVLVRVEAAGVPAGDARIRGARFPRGLGAIARLGLGITRPRARVLGMSFSGIVERVGASVTDLSPGDEVCGMTGVGMGAHAEFVTVPAAKLARKPADVSHEDAAGMLFGGTTALYFLRDKAGVKAGDTVLVNGASGAVGTNAIQLAKHFGATVTAVTSGANAELVTGLGADHVIDYTRTPLSAVSERFDVVLDAVGNLGSADAARLLTERGVLLLAVADLGQMLGARGRVKAGSAPERTDDIRYLLQLMEAGELVTVNEQVYPLEQIAAAYERVDSGRKVGNVVLAPGR